MTELTCYQNPLTERYASKEMCAIFSPQFKFTTWRRLWIALAKAEKSLGLPITDEMIAEMDAHVGSVNFDAAARYESELHHDVMAHIHAFGDQCPKAKPMIHLGATSCYVTDNGDLIQIRAGLELLLARLSELIDLMSSFSEKYRSTSCLGYTHYQPAQLTTVGKRASLWLQDFLDDLKEIQYRYQNLRFLGVRGATGTQASFLALFNGDEAKVKKLEKLVSEELGFSSCFEVTGQTYPRKQDAHLLNTLGGIGVSAQKCATDIRLLAHSRELEEPFGKSQVGSSAMPYKRNPMLSERICALGRFLMNISANASQTAATQWLERTLDDSANRRIAIPEAFLAADAILLLLIKIWKGIQVNEEVIAKHLREELPFIATENLLMEAVKKGGNRQDLHEVLRRHTHAAAQDIKCGKPNSLITRLQEDPDFALSEDEVMRAQDPLHYIGRAPQQVLQFLEEEVYPLTKSVVGGRV